MSANPIEMKQAQVPGQQTEHEYAFPLVLLCGTPNATLADAAEWIRGRRDELLKKATQHGAILFRGLPLNSPEDCDSFVAAFGLKNFPYIESLSNAVRVNYTERIFSANEAPADVNIYFHHEMAQTPIYPAKLFFFCQKAAEEGGETPLCRSDALFEELANRCPEFARNCEQKGLRYSNVMPSDNDPKSGMGRSWKSTLRAETREQAESRLREIGYDWEWLPDDCLRATTPILPAVRALGDGRKSFFNQLIAAFQGWKDERNDPSKAIRFGDGSPLDREAVNVATELAYEMAFDLPWQQGDAVIVDNFVTMHGRRTFRGTRKVLASLADPHKHEDARSSGDRAATKRPAGATA
ncbi:MAG TPA: TauD/TfdA family dioxygenase [Lacipirellulaceae bacterium]|nr:TauD/TfdA family dioxygenase [Lacipirellulaceae bacterium]